MTTLPTSSAECRKPPGLNQKFAIPAGEATGLRLPICLLEPAAQCSLGATLKAAMRASSSVTRI
jgi:hypothetical protein